MTMHELDDAVAAWRRELLETDHLGDREIVELEDHLWDSITDLLEEGMSPQAAFAEARKRLGDASALDAAYARLAPVGHPGRRLWCLAGGVLAMQAYTALAMLLRVGEAFAGTYGFLAQIGAALAAAMVTALACRAIARRPGRAGLVALLVAAATSVVTMRALAYLVDLPRPPPNAPMIHVLELSALLLGAVLAGACGRRRLAWGFAGALGYVFVNALFYLAWQLGAHPAVHAGTLGAALLSGLLPLTIAVLASGVFATCLRHWDSWAHRVAVLVLSVGAFAAAQFLHIPVPDLGDLPRPVLNTIIRTSELAGQLGLLALLGAALLRSRRDILKG
jgi:hypothetical protein